MTQPSKDQQLIQLAPNKLELFEQVSLRYDAEIAQGVKPEDLLKPEFWAHHAVRLRPMHEIRARAIDGTWVAYYIVLDCSRTWARVQLLSLHHLGTGDVAATKASELEVATFIGAHEVKHRGPRGWSVVRKADSEVLQENVGLKDDAIAWLEEHARKQLGVPMPAQKPAPVAA